MVGEEMMTYVFKLLVFLPMTLGMIFIVARLGQQGKLGINRSRHMKVIDRIQISKDNALFIAEIGPKKYLIGSSNQRIEILKELSEEELVIEDFQLEKMDMIESIKSIFIEGRKR